MGNLVKDPSPPGTDTVLEEGVLKITTKQHNTIIDRLGGETALTGTRVPILDAVGNLTVSSVTPTELNRLSGITAALVQTDDARLSDARTPLAHLHAISDVTGLQAALDSKSAIGHTHTKSDITDFSHTHAESDITGLVTDLSNKQPLDSDLTDIAALTPTNDDILQRKSGAWTNRTPSQLKTDLALTKSDVGLNNVDNVQQYSASNRQTAIVDSEITSVNISKLLVTSGTSGDIFYHNGSNVVRLPKGSDGQYLTLTSGIPAWANVGTTEQATFQALFDRIQPGNGKYMATLFNANAARKVVIQRIWAYNWQVSAVTGVSLEQYITGISARTAGTTVTPTAFDSNDTLSSSITADHNSSSVTETNLFRRLFHISEEGSNLGTQLGEDFLANATDYQLIYEKQDGVKGITLRNGEGISIKNVTNSTVGTCSYVIVFSDETA